jgi:hypothetical protein
MTPRIIELEIDEALTGETRVDSIALVEFPAIETEFMYFGRQKFYKAPDYVSQVACRAIRENEERGNPAGTQVGKIRAQQLCNQSEISLETIKRMKSFLERAATYYTGNYDDNGTIAYDLWGGKDGLKWVDTILDRIEKQEQNIDVSALPEYVNYPTGDTENDMLVEPVLFIEKVEGEDKQGYISRCIEYHIGKGYELDQAAAICYSQAEQEFDCGCSKQNMDIEPNPCWKGYEPIGLKDDGSPNCVPIKNSKQEFEVVGYMDGLPMFTTIEEAEEYGKEVLNCSGHHTHTDENGNEVYMSCDIHPTEMSFDFSEYTQDDYDFLESLSVIKENVSRETFERIMDAALRGYTEDEVRALGIRRATPFFKYDRVLDGFPDRDFCDSIEGRYFRRAQIDLLRDTNRDFGHEKQPYSKWLYKGGPNCVHAWRRYLVQGEVIADLGPVEGLPGTPPKNMPNNGYYSPETKKASEIAYAISQQNMTKSTFKTIIVDIDGSLVNGITPIKKNIEYVNSKWKDHRIVILTGRPESTRNTTIRELDRWGVRFDELIMSDRSPRFAPEFKKEAITKLVKNRYTIVEAIEDNSETQRIYRGFGIKVTPPTSIQMELIPYGYNEGFGVFEDRGQAEDYSYGVGCGGFVENIIYDNKALFQACGKNTKKQKYEKIEFKANAEKRMVYSPVMVPNVLIPRLDDDTGEKYFVKFTPETIRKIQNKFMIEQRLRETNYEHSNKRFKDVVMVESWIVDGENDKAYELGFTKLQVPKGAWMVGYKVLETPEGNDIWNNYIKTGLVRGFSIEGDFMLKFSRQKMDEYLYKEIINIIKNTKI